VGVRELPLSVDNDGQISAETVRRALRCGIGRCSCQHGRLVHCPAHTDRSPSLAVDDAGRRVLVYDHGGCASSRVISALRELKVWPAHTPVQSPALRRPWREQCRQELIEAALRQRWARPGILDLYAAADLIRSRISLVRRVRSTAIATGETHRAWEMLAVAARTECLALALEAALDESTQ
jgi:hypothetical protein